MNPDPDRLHRYHAAPATGRGGCSVDVGQGHGADGEPVMGIRWRPDGGPVGAEGRDLARAMARRIAVAWNAVEGWPTAALESGVLADVGAAARRLAAACADDGVGREELARMGRELVERYRQRDTECDMTGGRPADCDQCYPPPVMDDDDPGTDTPDPRQTAMFE